MKGVLCISHGISVILPIILRIALTLFSQPICQTSYQAFTFRHEVREGGHGGSWNKSASNSSSAGQSKSNSWLGGEPCNLKVSLQVCQSATLTGDGDTSLGVNQINIMNLPSLILSSPLLHIIQSTLL